MANLNLSEFTEKLFVTDADHTFIWDTAASISKRVSRNSWLSAGSIATSTPLTISQTWTDAAVAFAAMKIVATDTNSAAGSDFLELYSGTATQPLRLDIQKTGQLNIYGTWSNSTSYERLSFSAPTAANAIIGTNKGSGGGTARGLDLHTDGSARMTITTAGNVGIATTAPSTLLEVALPATGNVQGQGIKLSRGSGFFTLGNATSLDTFCGDFVGKGSLTGNALSLLFTGIAGSDSDTANPVMAFTSRNNANNAAIGNSQLAFQFRNYGTNLVTVLGSGNVGIGTTAPTAPLHVQATAGTDNRETLFKGTISDAGNDAFHIFNGTSANGRFAPSFSASTFSSNVGSLIFTGQTNAANDNGTQVLVIFNARITNSETDPNNGTLSAVTTRPLFAWNNHITTHMQMAANGNLGIGTTSPTSKLQVSAGDVEVDTIAKGVILKSPDGTRYRVTVANGGTLSVAAV